MLRRIRIVLLETQQPRNIGSIARAMKTMGLSQLMLVKPRSFPHKDALDLASGADDVLQQARVVNTLPEAISSCVAVYGASARRRHNPMPELKPRACAEHACALLMQAAEPADVALVFGSEPAGLDNDALLQCQYLLQIPANPAFASLNLAAAVQIICYELRLAAFQASDTPLYQPVHVPAQVDAFESFFQQLLDVSEAMHYFGNKSRSQASAQLRRIFQRAQADSQEIRMLRGWLSQIQFVCKNKP
jgi:tRNA (cytidine32/uridine32-2'-O)-methyltransferase